MITSEEIRLKVAELCIKANQEMPMDVQNAMEEKISEEDWGLARETLQLLQENTVIAKQQCLPICQDTGMISAYVTIGQDTVIEGDLQQAIQEGVAKGYAEGFLRCSMVGDPLHRENTNDNTPASITINLVTGDGFSITIMPKGFGSENMSKLAMLKPAEGVEGVVQFVLDTIEQAGSNACPPMVVGVGVGGNFEKAPYLAKKALLRPVNVHNSESFYANLEKRLTEEANRLGIGPQGFGGKTTVLAVAVEQAPTHVAGLPVAVNINCHVTRRATYTWKE